MIKLLSTIFALALSLCVHAQTGLEPLDRLQAADSILYNQILPKVIETIKAKEIPEIPTGELWDKIRAHEFYAKESHGVLLLIMRQRIMGQLLRDSDLNAELIADAIISHLVFGESEEVRQILREQGFFKARELSLGDQLIKTWKSPADKATEVKISPTYKSFGEEISILYNAESMSTLISMNYDNGLTDEKLSLAIPKLSFDETTLTLQAVGNLCSRSNFLSASELIQKISEEKRTAPGLKELVERCEFSLRRSNAVKETGVFWKTLLGYFEPSLENYTFLKGSVAGAYLEQNPLMKLVDTGLANAQALALDIECRIYEWEKKKKKISVVETDIGKLEFTAGEKSLPFKQDLKAKVQFTSLEKIKYEVQLGLQLNAVTLFDGASKVKSSITAHRIKGKKLIPLSSLAATIFETEQSIAQDTQFGTYFTVGGVHKEDKKAKLFSFQMACGDKEEFFTEFKRLQQSTADAASE